MLGLGSVRRPSALLAVLALATAGVISGVAPASPVGAQDGPPEQVLERDMRGEAAIQALGDRLPEVAALNDMTATEFRAALRADSMLWVDRTGRLLFVDEFLGHDEAAIDHGSLDSATVPTTTEVFALHSRPGAQRVIVLDFDGHDARGTAWGDTSAQDTAPYDSDGSPTSFGDAERAVIFSVWQRVAEDYAPFDIDVTTQDPGHGPAPQGHPSINRASTSDVEYGTRVVITPSKPYNCSCGGVAYVGVYDAIGTTHDHYQPAWVFTAGVGGAKNIAEAASHEAGHNLGLSHDGGRGSGYYAGHGDWAPIMGVGYYQPVTQWSRGEYSGANNKEDDFVVIRDNGGPWANDDWPSETALVSPVSGVIERRADVDSFTFSVPEPGVLRVDARAATVSPDLDIGLRVTGNGVEVSADPALVVSDDRDSTAGLDATIELAVTQGTYTIRVDGVGWGDPASTGYSDYGSLGRYTLSAAFTRGETLPPPPDPDPDPGGVATPTNLTTSVSGSVVTVGWTHTSPSDTFALERQRKYKGSWVETTALTAGAGVRSLADTPGSGTFRYRIQATDGAVVSDWSAWVEASTAGNGGGKPNKGSRSGSVPIS